MFFEGRQERYQILTLNVIKYLINPGTIILRFCVFKPSMELVFTGMALFTDN